MRGVDIKEQILKSTFLMKSYTGERRDIISMIQEAPTRVLDVGCSNGALGAAIKKLHPCCYVAGIEYDAQFAEEARHRLDAVFQADLDSFNPSSLPSAMDVLIFADVLEHTKNPAQVLSSLLSCATPRAQIIVSVPNVQHWTAIKNLLIGQWPQRDRGLFDRTHLRYFTLASLEDLAAICGCRIVNIHRNFRIVDQPGGILNRYSRLFRRLPLKRYFTYQYIVSLERNPTTT